ncbi:branched-chain amino acid ABC transporter permease [Actinophytocola sp.]|uniref:branched-chain amino acid ABC transporter permease n=1 Tax=Actinophytocola sp. TaxID=1872138 RepID=UPI003D6AB6B5
MWIDHLVSGVSFGMLLFLIASGLTLIFGLMGLLNLAHGAFYLIAAYLMLELLREDLNYWLAVAITVAAVTVVGMIIELVLLHRFVNQVLPQIVVTVGLALIAADLILDRYGGYPVTPPRPPGLSGSIEVAGHFFPKIRIAVIVLGVAVGLLMWLLLSRTRVGVMIRAAVDDEAVARSVGIPVPKLFVGVFGIGVALAALAGIFGGALSGLSPGVDFRMLLLSVVVVVVGGLGSLAGAFVASLLVGLITQFGVVAFPSMAQFALFVPVALFLAFRPRGLFGKEGLA